MLDTQIVALQGDHPTTNTLIIAEYFGKQHKHIMRDLRELMTDCPEEFNGSNFGLVEYYDSKGEKRPMYTLTRDGFMLLSMGFTGANATKLKIAFIDAFNKMEAALHQNAVMPGQVEAVQARRMKEELLAAKPQWRKVKRYLDMGLNQVEVCRLIGKSRSAVRHMLDKMAACGIIQRTVNPLLSAAGKRGNRKRLEMMGGGHVH